MSHPIVLVGHCGIDGPRLQDALSALDDCTVERANDAKALEQACSAGGLFLVNREPVGFDQTGIDLVRQIRQRHPDCKVMLVSDHPDAQRAARQAGALPGFGKSLLGSPRLIDAVKRGLEA